MRPAVPPPKSRRKILFGLFIHRQQTQGLSVAVRVVSRQHAQGLGVAIRVVSRQHAQGLGVAIRVVSRQQTRGPCGGIHRRQIGGNTTG